MKRRETILFTLILIICAYITQYVASPSGVKNTPPNDTKKLLALVGTLPSSTQLDRARKNSSCALRGGLPDHACTPGSVFADASTSLICVTGYTKTVRNVPVRVKKQVYANYNVVYPQPSGTYELDHLVPLELGGDNSVANLFPEAASPAPGFREKDVVENYLHEKVCSGAIRLSVAQEQIANDWIAVYDLLSSSTVRSLREKYKNWAD